MKYILFYFLIGLVWTFYRFIFSFPEIVDEIIFKPLIFVLPVAIWIIFKEKNSLLKSLWFTKRNLGKSILIGGGLGLIVALESLFVNLIKYKDFRFNTDYSSLAPFLTVLFISITTAFSEEILNRGFLMKRLWGFWKNDLLANVVSCVLFALLHLPMAIFVLHYHGWDIVTYELMVFILGFVDGYIFVLTKNLFAPIISHSIWNFFVVLFR